MIALPFFPVPFLAGLLGLSISVLVLRRAKRRPVYLLVFTLFWLYLMMVASLTLFPLYIAYDGEIRRSTGDILARVNLVPFHHNPAARFSFRLRGEMLANILMTIPFGLLLPLVANLRPWMAAASAVSIGLVIELTQFALNLIGGNNFRVADINDVIFNFTGAVVGFGIYILLRGAAWLARRLTK
ncbi:MAG TPA: VanZ family protein [Anaerolineaceae bacterium]